MNAFSKSKHKSQRVGIFIDTQNLYHSARSNYNSHVNYKVLVDDAVSGRRLIRAFAYVIKSESGEELKFFEALEELGIETRVKDLQVFYSGEKKADWDVGIAIDIVRMCEKLDVVVLVSGDGDFTEVIKYVRSRGIRAEIMSFKKTTSLTLVNEADTFVDLGEFPAKFLIPMSRGSVKRGSGVRKVGSGRSVDSRGSRGVTTLGSSVVKTPGFSGSKPSTNYNQNKVVASSKLSSIKKAVVKRTAASKKSALIKKLGK